MPFQTSINRELPRGVAGDFASTNPRAVMLAGDSALITAAEITVGYFAFADLATGKVYSVNAAGRAVGFVHRNNQAVVALGSAANMKVRAGKETALFTEGDFYAVLDGNCTVGQAITVTEATGAPSVTPVGAGFIASKFKAAEAATAGKLVKITVNGV